MFKKIIFIIVIVITILVIYNKTSKKFNKGEFDPFLKRIGMIRDCYRPHGGDFITTFDQEGFDYHLENEKVIKQSLAKIKQSKNVKLFGPKIPYISHSVYFKQPNLDNKLNPYYIENLKIKFSKLNETSLKWQHNIWTNDAELFPEEIIKIPGVKIRSYKEFATHFIYKKLDLAIQNGGKAKAYLAEASDLIRLMALEKEGGVYTDMDYEIYDPISLTKYMAIFNFIAARETIETESYYGNAFIAATSNHPIMVEALRRMSNHYYKAPSNPDYIKYPCDKYFEIFQDGPPNLTISYFSKANINNNNDVIFPTWMIFNTFIHYKNDSCDKAFNKDNFIDNFNNLDAILKKFYDEDIFKLEGIVKYSSLPNMYVDFGIREKKANIYYRFKEMHEYPIIGGDMRCATWTNGNKDFKPMHHWKFPWTKN